METLKLSQIETDSNFIFACNQSKFQKIFQSHVKYNENWICFQEFTIFCKNSKILPVRFK